MSITPRKIQRYGWRPDTPDHRDFIFNNRNRILDASHLPPLVDFEAQMPPVYDQMQLGSCTGNGVAAIVENAEMKQGAAPSTPSRLFIYYGERVIEGTVNEDAGAEIRDGIKVVASEGVPPESEWPYSDANPGPFQQAPPPNVYADAKKYLALEYQRIIPGGPGAPIRSALATGYPIVFGFPVPDYFEGDWDPTTTPLPVPDQNTNIIGGHCTVAVGYDFTRSRFDVHAIKIRNSWGTSWGEAGYFWMDAAWFAKGEALASDLWVITKMS